MIVKHKPLGFTKACRVHLKKDFEYLKDQSLKGFVPPLVLYSKKSRLDYSHARLGLSVSTKQGNAVRRNRIKRILREQFRLSPLRHSIPLDLLFVAAHKVTDEEKLKSSFQTLMLGLSPSK